MENVRTLADDKVKDYAHYVLETGFTLKYFLEISHYPDRDSFLGICKVMLIQLKALNPHAKYPLELMRFLVQQYSLLPLNQAQQVFQSMFVNLKSNKYNEHEFADKVMEWQVKTNKRHISHMHSNKTKSNIINRTAALAGFHEIANNFDQTAGVVIRAKKHSHSESACRPDNLVIMRDLRTVRPFSHKENRSYKQFPSIVKSPKIKLDASKLKQWFYDRKGVFVA